MLYRLFFFISLIFPSYVYAQEWVVPHKDVQTIFMQGMMDSQRQCAKYCGSSGAQVATGERVVCPTSNTLMRNPYIGKELDEVILHNSTNYSWYNPLKLVIKFQEQLSCWQGSPFNYQVMGSIPGMPSVVSHAINVFKLNFGQESDMYQHQAKVNICEQYAPGCNKILWGTSRGAATVFNAHAKYKYENIKMIILEGCFDTVRHTIETRVPYYLKYLGLHIAFDYFLSFVTEYKRNGISPLISVEYFPEDVPVVFITSCADRNVDKACTDVLVQKLKERGKNPIHYLVLQNSGHNNYAIGNDDDQKRYCIFLHKLYKKYNLPYILAYANKKLE